MGLCAKSWWLDPDTTQHYKSARLFYVQFCIYVWGVELHFFKWILRETEKTGKYQFVLVSNPRSVRSRMAWYRMCRRPCSAALPRVLISHWCNAVEWHDDVIKWKHFPRNWPFVWEIHRSQVISPHTGQWCGALMFSLICVWINGWVNNREAGDLRRYGAHNDVTVMYSMKYLWQRGLNCWNWLLLTMTSVYIEVHIHARFWWEQPIRLIALLTETAFSYIQHVMSSLQPSATKWTSDTNMSKHI